MQPASIDILFCLEGRFGGIETKHPLTHEPTDADATERQQAVMQEIRTAGGVAGVMMDVAHAERMIAAWPNVCAVCLEQRKECRCISTRRRASRGRSRSRRSS